MFHHFQAKEKKTSQWFRIFDNDRNEQFNLKEIIDFYFNSYEIPD
jgi:hypothetical protein